MTCSLIFSQYSTYYSSLQGICIGYLILSIDCAEISKQFSYVCSVYTQHLLSNLTQTTYRVFSIVAQLCPSSVSNSTDFVSHNFSIYSALLVAQHVLSISNQLTGYFVHISSPVPHFHQTNFRIALIFNDPSFPMFGRQLRQGLSSYCLYEKHFRASTNFFLVLFLSVSFFLALDMLWNASISS